MKKLRKQPLLTLTLLLSALSLSSQSAQAGRNGPDRNDEVPRIQLRDAYECSDLQVENTVDWLKGHEEVNKLDQLIGPPRHQGSVGWCFSYTARDLLHYQTQIAPEIGMIAKDYYTGFVGSITGFLSSNEGGYTYNNLKRTYKNGICEEGFLNKYATPENVEQVECVRPKISIKRFGSPKKHLNPHKGRAHALFSKLDQYLAQNQMVAIAYNANGLYKDQYRDDNFFTKYQANHASSIVGRYFDHQAKKCRYVIRNSWGTRHNYALSGPQREGYHTITEEDLSISMAEIAVFK